ncbi:MAG: hypothetical protein HRT38_19205 [Alteromonadaceae bacterium]|nr:hypothetical protein [Alteromonadaceae bacterium]
MKNNNYLLPGITAILLSVLFPIYWIQEITLGAYNDNESYFSNIGQLSFSSWVFLSIGLFSIYIYYCFRRILHDQLNFKNIDVLLWLMIGISVVFYLGLFLLDVWPASVDSNGLHMSMSYAISVGSMVIFGLVEITIGIILLRHFDILPSLLKAIAIVSLIQGIFELSIIFSFVVIFSFPVYLIILAVYFLRKPEMIEVV